MEEINNFQQEPDKNLYQAWERFKELLMKCPPYYLTEMHEVILFYNGLGIPTRQILDSRGPHYTKDFPLREEGKTLEENYYMQFGRPFQGGDIKRQLWDSIKRNNENSSYQERRQSMEGASIKTLEIQIGQVSSSTEANLRDQVKSISTTIEVDSCLIHRIRSAQYAVSIGQNRTLMYESRRMTILFPSHLNGYYYEEKKGSYGLQFSEAYSEAS
nr:hypothetical protein [Tanacetum cinerariifolium]